MVQYGPEIHATVDSMQCIAQPPPLVDAPFKGIQAARLRDQSRMAIDDLCAGAKSTVNKSGTTYQKIVDPLIEGSPIIENKRLQLMSLRETFGIEPNKLGWPMLKGQLRVRDASLKRHQSQADLKSALTQQSKENVLRFFVRRVVSYERNSNPAQFDSAVTAGAEGPGISAVMAACLRCAALRRPGHPPVSPSPLHVSGRERVRSRRDPARSVELRIAEVISIEAARHRYQSRDRPEPPRSCAHGDR